MDQAGSALAGAAVAIVVDAQPSATQNVFSDDAGQFSFAKLAPGPFHVTITADGFVSQTLSGVLHSGETYTFPRIIMALAGVVTNVEVQPARSEIAEDQIKNEEKQRVLGVLPNFYVSYLPDALPLTPRQKFELAWKASIDPVTFVMVGAIAGVEQARNDFSDYGQGAQGYADRYGAAYGDTVIGAFLGGAVFPTLLKQDPRFFYKGTGSRRSRVLYALAAAVICKGDNGRWQPNYSNLAGTLAAGAISNLYYPEDDRDGLKLTFENTLVDIGGWAGINLLQEFLLPKLTPKHSGNRHPQP